jgi:anti-sigma factor RsiW
MVCESWKAKLDTCLDGEIQEEEMRSFDAHVRSCPSCSADALMRVQMKRAIQAAGTRYTPSAEFRRRLQQKIAAKPRRSFGGMDVCCGGSRHYRDRDVDYRLSGNSIRQRSGFQRDCRLARGDAGQFISGRCDLHRSAYGEALVPGKDSLRVQFAGAPELRVTLLGGRMTYLDQTAGAHLIYDVRKHHISVFVFQERALPARLDENLVSPKKQPFNLETWSQGGLRYFVIGDASAADIDGLAKLLKSNQPARHAGQRGKELRFLHGAIMAR